MNCYKCKHRGRVPGSAHSSCWHPTVAPAMREPLVKLAGLMRGVVMGIMPNSLNIQAKEHGIRKGWFNWPMNFDPNWMTNCDGFEEKESAE